jgi:SAM-dependent methyltransferase
MTEEMIVAATDNVDLYAGDKNECAQVDFVCAAMDLSFEESTLEENFADYVMSNGAINLSHDKQAVFDTAYRTLKPGGWFLLSDACRVEKNPTVKVACSIGDSYTN